MLADGLGRTIRYLRLSVTDHCNLRCLYCMPLDAGPFKGRLEILTFEEIERLVRVFTRLGLRRVRLTGGEPLVRKDLPFLVRRLSEISGMQEVLLTTNGILLKTQASPLKDAGLQKINIHLDTLSSEKFQWVTRWGNLESVLEGIEEAERVRFSPIKLNMVVQRGFNDNEVEPLLFFAAERGLILRLIELMPIGPARGMTDRFIPLSEIRERLAEKYSLLPSGVRLGSGPAVYYKVKELGTHVGFISPVSEPFCGGCDRIRISSDGRFQDCLAYDGTFSLRDRLRDPQISDRDLAGEISGLLNGKHAGHDGFRQEGRLATPCMFGIGG